MSQPDFEISMLGIKIVPADVWTGIAGFGGALISLQFMGPMTKKEGAMLILSGLLCAQILSGMAADLAILAGWHTAGKFLPSIGLVIGIFCMSVIRLLIRATFAFASDPRGWLRLLLTRGQSS